MLNVIGLRVLGQRQVHLRAAQNPQDDQQDPKAVTKHSHVSLYPLQKWGWYTFGGSCTSGRASSKGETYLYSC